MTLVLVILLLFAGESLEGFAFTMLIGIITGTYSSIYIASASVVDTMIARGKLDPKAQRDFIDQHTRIAEERRQRKTRSDW